MKRLIITLCLGTTALIALSIVTFYAWGPHAPVCDKYGGWSAAVKSCTCIGVKYTEIDEAPADGFTIRRCVGIIK